MIVQQKIEQKLNLAFSPQHLDVKNESYMHRVAKGSESHFNVIIVSDHFEGKALLARHRAVNSTLEHELKNDIHALAIHTYTPKEWQNVAGKAPDSIRCPKESTLDRNQ